MKTAMELDENMRIRPVVTDGIRYVAPDEEPLRLSGLAFFEREHRYRRLPCCADGRYREPVDALAWHTSGGQIAFRSDTRNIVLKVKLRGAVYMDHMPPTGHSGFDLYVGAPGAQRFFATTRIPENAVEYTAKLYNVLDAKMREFTLNFPLYNGVDEVWVGVDEDARLEAPTPWQRSGRIVVYGTSITQGGCASHPGMSYTNIWSRKLNMEVLNFGFSGNGRGEPELAETLAAIADVKLFVLDYEANAGEGMRDTLENFVRILHRDNPQTPILVLTRTRSVAEINSGFGDGMVRPEHLRARLEFQREVVKSLRAQGVDIALCDGGELLGADWDECTVEGVHYNDLGFARMAEKLLPAVQACL